MGINFGFHRGCGAWFLTPREPSPSDGPCLFWLNICGGAVSVALSGLIDGEGGLMKVRFFAAAKFKKRRVSSLDFDKSFGRTHYVLDGLIIFMQKNTTDFYLI